MNNLTYFHNLSENYSIAKIDGKKYIIDIRDLRGEEEFIPIKLIEERNNMITAYSIKIDARKARTLLSKMCN